MIVRDNNKVPDVLKRLKELQNSKVRIGVLGDQDSFMVMIASVHEFGADIKPKGKYLAIPLKPELRDISPRQLGEDLFVPKGKRVLARKSADGTSFEALYALVKEVKIPERSFLRSSFDENKDKLSDFAQAQFMKVISGQLSPKAFYERLGEYCKSMVQRKIKDIKEPPKSAATLAIEGPDKNNPLIDTGRLRNSINYEVVGK